MDQIPSVNLTTDASNNLCIALDHIPACEYTAMCQELAENFNLKPRKDKVVGLDVVFQTYRRGEAAISLEWDNWSGFIVVALNDQGANLVREIAAYFSDRMSERGIMNNEALLKILKEKVAGLLYMSESDFPLEPFAWTKQEVGAETLDSKTLAKFKAIPTTQAVTEETLKAFFDPMTEEEDWFGAEEKETAKGFRELVATLETHLKDVKVFKVGDARKDVYVVGKTETGDFAGVTTQVVET